MTTRSERTTRALIYARLSPSPKGVEAKGGNLDQQVSICAVRCEAEGWQIVDTIAEVDTSATSSKPRPGWREVVRKVEAHEVDVVVGRHYDRLYRRPVDLEELVALTESTGVLLVAAEGGEGLDLTTATGRAQARFMAAGAALETDVKRERQIRGHERRAEAGKPWWNTRPLGFERDGTIRQGEAEHVREAFRDLLAGHSLYSIAKRWNVEGFTTPKGNPWRSSNLRTAIVNPRNAAIHTYRGEPTGQTATWDPIVSRELYDAVHRILSAPGRQPDNNGGKRKGLLTNVARCGLCGAGMIRHLSRPTKAGDRHPRYTCRACRRTSMPSEWLDQYVMNRVILQTRSEEWLSTLTPDRDETDERATGLRVERATLEARKGDLAAMFADGEVDREALRVGTERANGRLAEVEAELSSLVLATMPHADLADDLEVLAERFTRFYQDDEFDRLRSIFSSVVESIEVLPRGKGARVPKPEDVRIKFREGVRLEPAPRPERPKVEPSPVWAEARAQGAT